MSYRFPEFDDVRDSAKDMNICVIEAMDAVYNNPEDWKEREYYVQHSINGVKKNRERGLKAAETAKANKQMAMVVGGLPKT